MHIPIVRLFFLAALSVALTACSGGGGAAPAKPERPGQASYTLSTTHDAGSTIAPASAVVVTGSSASFTVQALPGFIITSVSGAGGNLVGNTYTTAAVAANATIVVNTAPVSDVFSIHNMRMIPRALFDDEFKSAPFTIEVATSGRGFTLYASHLDGSFDASVGSTQLEEQLYDDATHGDKVAGDGVYTRTLQTGLQPRLRYHDGTVDALQYRIVARNGAGTELLSANLVNPTMELGVVSRAQAVPIARISDGVYAASHMVNVVMPGYRLKADYLVDISTRLYANFDDLFDAQVVFSMTDMVGVNVPQHVPVKQVVNGTNQPTFDMTASYGSGGKLQQVIEFKSSILGAEFNHEIGHQWAFFLNKPELDLTRDSVSNQGVSFHMGSPSTIYGQMSNSLYLSEQANADFLVTMTPDNGNIHSRVFSDLELYLMGLVPPSGVSPFRFVLDSTVHPAFRQVLPRNQAALVTIDDIIRVYGQRVPSSGNSQKAFRVLFVGVSEMPMTAAEITIINRNAAYFGGNAAGGQVDTVGLFPVKAAPSFNAATRGLATMMSAVPPKK